jgi:tetratricopeptide (TPR) repeat protein
VDSHRLSHLVEGDLDWIVMKCLDKDRTRRYETATGLAEDIHRYLSDEPVHAGRPTRAYRLKKFIRRNKASVLAGSAIVAALSVGLATSLYFAASASREAKAATVAFEQAELNRKNSEGVNAFFTEEVFGLSNPGVFNRRGLSLTDALDIAAGKVEERFPDDPELSAVLYDRLGDCYYGTDQSNKAVEQYARAAAVWASIGGPSDARVLMSQSRMGAVLSKMGRNTEALRLLESSFVAQSRLLGAAHADTLCTALHLGFAMMRERDTRDIEFTRDAFQRSLAELGPHHPQTLQLQCTYSLGSSLARAIGGGGQPCEEFRN